MNIFSELVALSLSGSVVELEKRNHEIRTLIANKSIGENIANFLIVEGLSHPYLFLSLSDVLLNMKFYKTFDNFLKKCDLSNFSTSQLNLLYEAIEKYLEFMNKNQLLVKALNGVEATIDKLGKSNFGLTPLHNIYLSSCIQAKMYKKAVYILNKPVIDVNKQSSIAKFFKTKYYYSIA